MYKLELERVAAEIRRKCVTRVLLQLPDGMRPFAFQMAGYLKKATTAEIILSGDSCYGACDIASRQAKELGADLLIHYGHTCFAQQGDIPTLYVEARVPIDVDKLVEALVPHLSGRRVGLTSTIQHTDQLISVAERLKSRGFEALIGQGGGTTPECGQVLGCSYAAATTLPGGVDTYVFIGGGMFHPIGLALTTGKPVVIVNPYDESVSRLEEAELMQLAKRRMAAIAAASKAKTVGVLVSAKPGQRALSEAMIIAEKLGDRGVTTFLIYLDEVRADQLNNFTEPEAFVDTACPRIAVNGVAGLDRPILTVAETRVLLRERSWEETWGPAYFS